MALQADKIIQAVKVAGVRFVVALPDRQTSEHVLKPMLKDPDLRIVQVCKEDEGVSICCGLFATGHKAVLMMQYTGLLDSVNAIRGEAVEGQNPVCMIVGLLGKEPGVPPKESKRFGVRIVEPILDAMGIEHHLIEETADVSQMTPAIRDAYANRRPVALLVGVEPRQP